MSKAVNQHWVPQFYLREFATPQTIESESPQVWIFSKRDHDGDERLTSIRNVCAKRYLYSPKELSGNRSWDIDDSLQRVESLLAQIWSAVAHDLVDFSDQSVRRALALFIATTHVRHPDNVQVFRSIHRHIVASAEVMPKRPDGTPDVEGLILNDKEYELDASGWHSYRAWSDDDHHRFFAETIRSESGYLANLLLKKRWSVVLAEDNNFITSDRPVSLQHQTRKKFGVGTPGVIVSFPLSPTRILIMDDRHERPANQYYPLMPGNSGVLNFSIWRAGSRFMITGRRVLDVLAEITEWAGIEGFA